jgi:hypothetical protein
MSNAVSTTGVLIKRALIATPTVFTTIAEIVTATPPGFSRNKIETTNHNDAAESYVLGVLRQKDPTFRINWVGSEVTHEDLMDDLMGNIKYRWQFAFPSGITMTGDGFVQRFEPGDTPVDSAQTAEIAIAWAGPITTVTA